MKKEPNGYALIITMIVLIVLSILGTVMLNIASAETKMVANQVENKQAYYAARAGADAMASHIISESSTRTSSAISVIVQELITKTSTNPATGTIGGTNSFEVQVSNITSGPYNGDLLIESQGTAGSGILPVKVNLVLRQTIMSALDAAIFSDQSPTLGNNTVIAGDIATNGPSIIYGNSTQITGDVVLGPDATPADIQNVIDHGDKVTIAAKIEFPLTDPNLFLEVVPGIYPTITLNADNEKRYIKVPGVDEMFKNSSNKVTIKWAPSVSLPAKAEVHLFLSNLSLSKPLTLPDGVTLYLYYNGTDTITGNGLLGMNHVVIYAPKATFDIQGGGAGNFTGKMIVKNVNLPSSNPSSGETITNDTSIDLSNIVGGGRYQIIAWLKP